MSGPDIDWDGVLNHEKKETISDMWANLNGTTACSKRSGY